MTAKVRTPRIGAATPDGRIAAVETAVDNLHDSIEGIRLSVNSEFRDIRGALDSIQSKLGRSRETNWTTVLTGVLVTLALWAAAIRPLDEKVNEQRTSTTDAARAVLVQNTELQRLANEQIKVIATNEAMHESIRRMEEFGTSGTSSRLGKMETGIGNITDEIKMLQTKGSPECDKRLSLIEQKLKGKP